MKGYTVFLQYIIKIAKCVYIPVDLIKSHLPAIDTKVVFPEIG